MQLLGVLRRSCRKPSRQCWWCHWRRRTGERRVWWGLRAGRRRRSHSFGEWRMWWWMWAGGRGPSRLFASGGCVGRSTKDPRTRLRSGGWQWGMWGRPKPSRSLGELRVQWQVRRRPYARLGRVRVDETPHACLESVGCGSWCGWAMRAHVLICRAEGMVVVRVCVFALVVQ